MKKRISIVFISSVLLLFCVFAFMGFTTAAAQPCYAAAAEVVETTETPDIEETAPEVEQPSTDVVEENPTFFGRLWEYITQNYAELISTVGAAIGAILAVVLPAYSKKGTSRVNNTALRVAEKSDAVIGAVNELIENFNGLDAKLAEYNSTESEKYKAYALMVVQTRAILEILITVYANSKNIPQGVKDIVNLKYADVLKLVGDTENLFKTVENTTAEEGSNTEQTEE